MTLLLDLIAVVFCVISTVFVYSLFRLIKSRYFLPIVIALGYASLLRLIILLNDFEICFGITKGHVQIMFSLFYIFLTIGIGCICLGFKKFLNR